MRAPRLHCALLALPFAATLLAAAGVEASHDASVPAAAPRIIWIREWGIHLREGIDVVHAYGVYYRFDAGRWHFSYTPAGPWRAVDAAAATPSPASPPVAAIPRDGGERRPEPDRGREAHRIVDIALVQLGAPYVLGGTDPSGFDCSGFVQYVFAAVGISLPRNAARQYRHGVPVTREELQPGDLVFFDRLQHNGIYIGDGRIIHAARSSRSVAIAHLDDPWFERRWVGARRMFVDTFTARGD